MALCLNFKENQNSKNHFRLNSGNYGFLMNKFQKSFIKNLVKAKTINISP